MADRPARMVTPDVTDVTDAADAATTAATTGAIRGDSPGRAARRRHLRRVGGAVVWWWTAVVGLVAISQAVGFTWIPLLFVLQALTPYLFAPSLPIAAVAAWRRHTRLAAVHAGIVVALAVLAVPLVVQGDRGSTGPDPVRLRVAHANTYYRTVEPDAAARTVLAFDADVLAVTEYSWQFGAAFERAGGDERYPYAERRSPGDRNGIALFSRYPIVEAEITPVHRSMLVDATVSVDGTPVRVVVAHPLPGMDRESLAAWSADLAAIDERVDPDPRTVLLGDFNASWWHPLFRDLLDEGWVDAHESVGRATSMSWPNDLPGPAFVRIDHALLGTGVVADAVRDVDVPGSDHRAFVLELAVERSGTSG
ncbi:MAG: endonuclease/exonuclease/phosphatase family protein [Actinomycetes bacterium]